MNCICRVKITQKCVCCCLIRFCQLNLQDSSSRKRKGTGKILFIMYYQQAKCLQKTFKQRKINLAILFKICHFLYNVWCSARVTFLTSICFNLPMNSGRQIPVGPISLISNLRFKKSKEFVCNSHRQEMARLSSEPQCLLLLILINDQNLASCH